MIDTKDIDDKNLMEWAVSEAARLTKMNQDIGYGVSVSSKTEFRSPELSGFILRIELVPEHEIDDEEDEE